MATRAEIEARMAAQMPTTGAPQKRTRAEIEAQMSAPVKKTPEQLQREAEAARLQVYRDMEAENSFGDNFLIGAGDALVSTGRGLDQLGARGQQALEGMGVSTNAGPAKGRAVGMGLRDDVTNISGADRLASSQKEEAALREMLAPVRSSGGGIVGNMVMNGLLTAPVGGVGGSAMKLATNPIAKTALAAGAEGAIGAGMGALAPTVEGESVTDNMLTQGALGAAMPVAGALLRTKPVQKVADKILDYTPVLEASRRGTRNKAIAEANKAAVAGLNKARDEGLDTMRTTLAKNAGWDSLPTDKIGAEQALKKVGQDYGSLIDPVKFDVSSVVPEIKKIGADTSLGLNPQDYNFINGIASRLENSASVTGAANGEMYKKLRSDITKKMSEDGTSGIFLDQLNALKDGLDNAFEAAVGPAELDMVRDLRSKYSLGIKLNKLDWDPKTGFKPEMARRLLDRQGDRTGSQRYLIDALRDLPEKAKLSSLEPKQTPQQRDIVKMGAVIGTLGAVTSPAFVASLPFVAGGVKGASNKFIREATARALRAANMGYGSNLTPAGE